MKDLIGNREFFRGMEYISKNSSRKPLRSNYETRDRKSIGVNFVAPTTGKTATYQVSLACDRVESSSEAVSVFYQINEMTEVVMSVIGKCVKFSFWKKFLSVAWFIFYNVMVVVGLIVVGYIVGGIYRWW